MNTMKAHKAGDHKKFLKNEGKDMKQYNFFTANNKQHAVFHNWQLGKEMISVSVTIQ